MAGLDLDSGLRWNWWDCDGCDSCVSERLCFVPLIEWCTALEWSENTVCLSGGSRACQDRSGFPVPPPGSPVAMGFQDCT